MKMLVLMKRVMDCSRQVSIEENEVRAEGSHCPMMDNPADLSALELAIGIKQTAPGSTVTALSLGGDEATEILVNALSRGADRAIHVNSAGGGSGLEDPFLAAAVLAEVIKGHKPDLVFCGTKSFDTSSAQLGGLISQFIGLPYVSNAVKVEISADKESLHVQRKLEKGRKLILKCPLPALIAVEVSVAEPKYLSLFRQMKVNRGLVEQVPFPASMYQELQTVTEVIKVVRTKPRAKKSDFTTTALSPLKRMKLMAGQKNSEQGKLIDGDREVLAREIISYLEQKKIISGKCI